MPLAITTASLPNGADDAPYSATITTTGGTAPITFSISAGALPTGMSLDANTGIISGTPTTGGPFGFTLQDMDAGTPHADGHTGLHGSGPRDFYFGAGRRNGRRCICPAAGGRRTGGPFELDARFRFSASRFQTIRVSVAHDGSQSSNPFFTSLGMSGAARLIAFNSFDETLVPGGISFNGIRQIVVRDTCIGVSSACTPTTFLLSQRPDGTVANDVNGSSNERPVLSGDGRFAIFRSRSTNLVLTGNTGGPHIYRASTGR